LRNVLSVAQDVVLCAFLHGEYPYEWTMRDVGWSRPANRPPLFDVMIAMHESRVEGTPAAATCQLLFELDKLPTRAKEGDLLFAFRRVGKQLGLSLTYNTELFSPANIRKRAVALQENLERISISKKSALRNRAAGVAPWKA